MRANFRNSGAKISPITKDDRSWPRSRSRSGGSLREEREREGGRGGEGSPRNGAHPHARPGDMSDAHLTRCDRENVSRG